MSRKLSKSSPWERFDAARQKVLGEINPYPDRSFTAAEYAKRYGLEYPTAIQQLRVMVSKGILETGRKWAYDARGHRSLTKCFWLREDEK